jgi:uncharacterized RDD family membrane protein YckC
MAQTSACAKCGTLLPSDAPGQMCPKCLIAAGLMSEVGVDELVTVDEAPHAPAAAGSDRPMPAGARAFGGYHLIRPLGKGGMGTVYEAEEKATGRHLALKVLSHSLDSEQARARFFREGRLAASVNHPNSVYVFGTEEIDDMPVITMELAPGGTLHDLVKRRGALPVHEAVDTILQIIAGLEAAAAGGVLHRDVKPSNCFIDADGTVKVGDFGLSISTLARREASVTTTGAVLGTPAYASPEQLRGDEIDSRSDIYAVGVTLYYLLTAQLPFTADNMVRLLATVLERPAPTPRKVRPDIPQELGDVVQRCMAKQPAQRFRNYQELRHALLPFTSQSAVPATLGLRFLAGFLDYLLVMFIGMAGLVGSISEIPHGEVSSHLHVGRLIGFALGIYVLPFLCLAIPEGLFGVTLGKVILGLRVVGLKRNRPGIPRAILRSAIVFAAFILGGLIQRLSLGTNQFQSTLARIWVYLAMLVPLACIFLLFATARRKNGNAAVQDLWSGTRVVLKPNWQTRSAAAPVSQPEAITQGTERIGPYHVLANLGGSSSTDLVLGYDTRLFRKVWIRRVSAGTPELSPARKMLARRGRLRWLGGRRAEGENWDAYEALSGRPLGASGNRRQSWKNVRFWLTDVAEELDAALGDQSLPAAMAVEQVWITDDGRVKLLDFAPPRITEAGDREETGKLAAPLSDAVEPLTDRDAQRFLKMVAIAALEGRPPEPTDLPDRAPNVPMPLHARSLVLRIGAFPSVNALVSELHAIRNLPAEISSSRRLVLLAGCVLPPVLLGTIGAIFIFFFGALMRGENHTMPEFGRFTELKLCLDRLDAAKSGNRDNGTEQALQTYVAGTFGDLVANSKEWHNPVYSQMLTADQRRRAETIVASRAPVSEKDLSAASQRVKSLGVDLRGFDNVGLSAGAHTWTGKAISRAAMIGLAVWAIYVGVPAMIAAILFRGGLLLYGLRIAVVTRQGAPARRLHVLWRSLIAWLPPFVAGALLDPLPMRAGAVLFIIVVCLYGGAALWSLRTPECTVADILARTRMVPR